MKNANLISIIEFCHLYQIETQFLFKLEESGLIHLIQKEEQFYIATHQLPELERYIVLHQDLDINLPGLEVLSHVLPRIERLYLEIQELKNQIRFYEHWGINPDRVWKDFV